MSPPVLNLGRRSLGPSCLQAERMGDHGQNNGRDITNINVVKNIKHMGTWNGKSATVTFKATDVAQGGDSVAVLVQKANYGTIIGAITQPIQ